MNKQTRGKPSVSNNYILNMLVNIVTLLAPLITTPYISRTLGTDSIGIYSYCLSIETYFVMLGTLGMPVYAKREIATVRNDENKLNERYSELITLQITTLSLALVLYVLLTVVLNTQYRYMFLACGLGIVAALFDVSWLFLGLENFAIIVRQGITFKLVCIALIFAFVKKPQDLYIYALCLMLANLVCNVWVFISAIKRVKYKRPSFKKVFHHLKPAFVLLLPGMVTTIYAMIDKTMLGTMSGSMAEVGLYEQSQKIVTVSLTLITSLGAVLMPRLATLFGQNDFQQFRAYVVKAVSVTCFISIPLAVGCFAASDNIVPWFYGAGFEKIKTLLKIFAPMFLFMGMSDLIGSQIFIATKREKKLLWINLATVVINLSLNYMLIPQYQACGVAFATVVSEMVKCAIFLISSRHYLDFGTVGKSLLKYSAAAAVMFVVVRWVEGLLVMEPSIISTGILVASGGAAYGLLLLLAKDQWVFKLLNTATGMCKKIVHRG